MNNNYIKYETYVSNETANMLNHIGFDLPCRYYYIDNSNIFIDSEYESMDFTSKFIPRPSLELVNKWLRDVKKIYIQISVVTLGYVVIIKDISNFDRITYISNKCNFYKSYEEALENSIKFICNFINDKKNEKISDNTK